MSPFHTILFDFDGTIMNTMDGITRGVQYALQKMGVEPPPQEALTCFIGPPLSESFSEFYHLSEADALRATQYYREYYSVDGLTQCAPYPGIGTLLGRLRAQEKLVALATSKPQPFAEEILRTHGLLDSFHILSGAGLDGSHNAKVDVIRRALEQLPGHGPAIMVGDRKFDVEGAHLAGLPCIGVLYGFGDRAEFEAAGADYIAADVAELESLLLP